jgi:hypothetical protein
MSWSHPSRWLATLILLPLALTLHAPAAGAQQPSAVFDLDSGREPMVSLDSGWRFQPGDNPTWSDPAFDDSAWQVLDASQPWTAQGYSGMSGFAWYRFTLRVPAHHEKLALELAPIMTTYQLFLDGRLAGQVGAKPGSIIPSANWNYALYPLDFPPGQPHTVHVAIRVWHSPIWASYVGGGPWAPGNLFGSVSLLTQQQHAHHNARRLLFVDLFCYAIAATIISLTIFALYAFRPNEREYLWFGLLLLAKALDAALNISKELYAVPSIPIYDLLDASCISLAQAALLLFLTNVLRLQHNRLRNALLALMALSPLFCILYWPGWIPVPVSALLQILCLLPSSIWMLAILASCAARRDATARLLLVPVFLVQGLWMVNNVLLAIAQFGLLQNGLIFDTPFIRVPYRLHPAVIAELLFLLAMLVFLIRRFSSARQREERFESELEAARQVQQVVLPAQIDQIPGFAVECVYLPAERVGGDFFQILPLPAGGMLVVAGDVAGKGLPAALMVSMLVGAVRAEACHTSDPATLLAALNDSSCGHTHGKFTTCLCMHIDADGHARIANAGHLSPYLDGVEIPTDPELPLGILRNLRCASTNFTLTPGARLTILSDGVVEARSHEGELYGFERTQRISNGPAAEIAEAARTFGQNDDITVLSITYLGSAGRIAAESLPPMLAQR